MTDADNRSIEIDANGWRFNGLEWGPPDGAVVLLLHGFPQTAGSWTAVGRQLGALGVRAVAMNQRGYSTGARPADVADYAMPNLVADARAFIDILGGPVDLVGHDWGGVVGWQLAARHPELLASWVAVSTPNQLALNAALAVDAEQRERFDYIRVFRQPGRAEAALLADDAARLRAMYGPTVAPARIQADVETFQEPGALTAALNWYRAMSENDADGLEPVTVATTYVWGSDDRAFGRGVAESTGAYVSAPYRFLPLEGQSHWLPDEVPDLLVAEILARRGGSVSRL